MSGKIDLKGMILRLLLLAGLCAGIGLVGCKEGIEPEGDSSKSSDYSYRPLPQIDSQEELPIMAAYHTSGFSMQEFENYMFVAWPDGTVIFSGDLEKGGPPFFKGTLSQSKIDSFLESIGTRGVFDRTYIKFRLIPDSGWTMLYVDAGEEGILTLESFHEYAEQRGKSVFTDRGIEPLEGRTIKEVLAQQSQEYQLFRADWDFIRDGFENLVPDEKTAIQPPDFKLVYDRRDAKR